MTSKIFYALMHKINPAMPKGGFDFFLLDAQPRAAYNAIEESNRFLQGDILWLGFKRIFIPYERKQRQVGRSQWSFRKKLKYLIDGFLTTSYVPIRFMSYIGIGVSFLGFAYALYIVFHWWANKTPFDGWAPIMIVLLLTSGLLMIMLGIIGEYLWRAYDESRKRGQYIIKSHQKNN
jgi:dolichol-phosphate mannosyltransferase